MFATTQFCMPLAAWATVALAVFPSWGRTVGWLVRLFSPWAAEDIPFPRLDGTPGTNEETAETTLPTAFRMSKTPPLVSVSARSMS